MAITDEATFTLYNYLDPRTGGVTLAPDYMELEKEGYINLDLNNQNNALSLNNFIYSSNLELAAKHFRNSQTPSEILF